MKQETQRLGAGERLDVLRDLSLVKPSSPKEAIVRLIFKATVVSLEVKSRRGTG